MGILTPLAVTIGSLEFMPRYLPQIVATDTFIQKASRGRITLLDIAGLPNLTLVVKGRKSGQWRRTPLLAVPKGDDWLVAGSNFGGPKQPVWVLNLEATPDCAIIVKGRRKEMRARRLDGEERAEAWELMTRTWPNYTKYEERTDRQIKVFLLTPR